MNFKEMSFQEIADFIKKEIPFDSMTINGGVYETSPIAKDYEGGNLTIGVTCVTDKDYTDEKLLYIFNIFTEDEFIDYTNCRTVCIDEGIPDSVLSEMKDVICGFMEE